MSDFFDEIEARYEARVKDLADEILRFLSNVPITKYVALARRYPEQVDVLDAALKYLALDGYINMDWDRCAPRKIIPMVPSERHVPQKLYFNHSVTHRGKVAA